MPEARKGESRVIELLCPWAHSPFAMFQLCHVRAVPRRPEWLPVVLYLGDDAVVQLLLSPSEETAKLFCQHSEVSSGTGCASL